MPEDAVTAPPPSNVIPLTPKKEPSIYELFPELAPFFLLTNKLRRRCADLSYGEDFVAWLQESDEKAGYVGNIHTSDTISVINLARELMIIGMGLAQLTQRGDQHAALTTDALEKLHKGFTDTVQKVAEFDARIKRIEARLGIKEPVRAVKAPDK